MPPLLHKLFYFVSLSLLAASSQAVEVNALFSDHMVLQRDVPTKVWGWGTPDEEITVTIAEQEHRGAADAEGNWAISLEPMPAGGPHQLVIQGNNKLVINDLLFGEVWVCSGQSNMRWPIKRSRDHDLIALKKQPENIRIITVPEKGTQISQRDFNGAWTPATNSEALQNFSAVGYHFGKTLNDALDVPIGLICCSWGGSAAEAWVNRDLLEQDPRYAGYLSYWQKKEAEGYDAKAAAAAKIKQKAAWEKAVTLAKSKGEKPPKEPRYDNSHTDGQHRPANLYNGMLKSIMGYSIKGVIWYQGESNAGRAKDYNALFSTLITSWRSEWGLGDFPFYWVNLANFFHPADWPQESPWAELREAQTQTLSLPNTGQALAIDIGEAGDIHPRDKLTVGKRLARIALARDYAKNIAHKNPQLESATLQNSKVSLQIKDVGGGLRLLDRNKAQGFAIAAADRKFVWAKAELNDKDQILVWHDQIKEPVEVRYAWADNPKGNVFSEELLPLTPFRIEIE